MSVKAARNDWIEREFVLKTPITEDLPIDGERGTVVEIRSAKLFLAIGITFAVLVLIVGVMMWFGQQHLAKLRAQQPAQEQAQQAHGSDVKIAEPASISLTKQAAVEHCRQVPDIKDWLRCMEREGVNTSDLLKTGQ